MGAGDFAEEFSGAPGFERQRAREHLVRKHTECPYVRSLRCLFAANLLGRKALKRANHEACRGKTLDRAAGGRNGDAEVQKLEIAPGTDFDVGALEVAMNDALRVHVFQRAGTLGKDGNSLRGGPGAQPRGDLLQRFAIDELHNHHRGALKLSEVIEAGDPGVAEAGLDLRFVTKALQEDRIVGRGGQDFHRGIATQAVMLRTINTPHPALAKKAENTVFPDDRVEERIHFGGWCLVDSA